jgi:hypothetical protein
MTITSQPINFAGNLIASDGSRIQYDSMLNAAIPGGSTAHPTVTVGTGAPTFAAAQGSLYLNITGSSTSTRAYINTTGSTTWTAITTAA